jgi:hypothetical protein
MEIIMPIEAFLLLFLICTPALLGGWDFLILLIMGKRAFGRWFIVMELIVIIMALIYLWIDTTELNSCCASSATFSPEHRLSIIVLVGAAPAHPKIVQPDRETDPSALRMVQSQMGFGHDLYPDETAGMVFSFGAICFRQEAGGSHRATVPGARRPDGDRKTVQHLYRFRAGRRVFSSWLLLIVRPLLSWSVLGRK